MTTPLRIAALALAALLAACGREEAVPPEPAAEAPVEPVAEAPSEPAATPPPGTQTAPLPPPTGATAPLVASDLDLYVKGMQREIEILKGHADALAKARAAKDQNAEMSAMMALGGVEVRDAGAAAAGLDVERYVTIKERVEDVLSALEMGVAMKPQLDAAEKADLSGFTEEQRKQHEEGLAQLRAAWAAPYERLPADVVDAFKAREAELAKLRAEAIALRLGAIGG